MEHYWLQAHMMVLQEYGQKMVSQTFLVLSIKQQWAVIWPVCKEIVIITCSLFQVTLQAP